MNEKILDIIIEFIALLSIGFIGIAIISGILSFAYWYIFLMYSMFCLILLIFTTILEILITNN